MDFLLSDPRSDERTVLSSLSHAEDAAGRSPEGEVHRSHGAVDIWRNLLLLTRVENEHGDSRNSRILKLYKDEDFNDRMGEPPLNLGFGVSYTVDRRSMMNPETGGAGDYVAVKTLNFFKQKRQVSDDASRKLQLTLASVLKELRVLTHPPLHNHANIATLLGYYSGSADGQTINSKTQSRSSDIALVMEFSPFGTLREFLQEKASLSLDIKVHIMHDLAQGLKALHDCRIAHGDLKLENTLVFPDKTGGFITKWSDFGNSLVDLDLGSRRYLGTPLMSAPEVRKPATGPALLEPALIYKCDMFSYGLMVWEILLDGRRFTAMLRPNMQRDGSEMGMVEALNSLPKDDILLHALICADAYQAEDPQLYRIVQDILNHTLWEDAMARCFSADLVDIFEDRGYSSARAKAHSQSERSGPAPLPADLGKPLASTIRNSSSFKDLRKLPSVVQDDLISLLQSKAYGERSTDQERAHALYDLAMCTFGGVQTSDTSVEKGMQLLVEAAEHASHESLLIAFRLHEALCGAVPKQLLLNTHPLAELQHKILANTEPDAYMSQRIIQIEKLYQREALNCVFDIFHGDKRLFSCRLPHAVKQLVQSDITFHTEDLHCKPQSNIMNSPPLKTHLFPWAARLNIHPLVEYLAHHNNRKYTSDSGLPERPLFSGEVLSAACEGGQLAMLRWLTRQDFHFTFTSDTVLFHWLTKFSTEDMAEALKILLVLGGAEMGMEFVSFDEIQGPQTRQRIFPGPTDHLLASRRSMELGGAQIRGTTLEFALQTNNKPLLLLLLGLMPKIGGRNPLSAVGWTETTFDTAISLNLWTLIPIVAASEQAFRKIKGAEEDDAEARKDGNSERLLPHALSAFGMPDDPILPFLIHGPNHDTAMEKTLDVILGEGLCDINDADERGDTPLSSFLQFAPCDFTANAGRHLLSRGARISQSEEKMDITGILRVMSKTRSHRTSAELIRTLIEAKKMANKSELLATVIDWGNLDAVRMLCGLDCNSHRLRSDLTLSELPEDLRATALGIAIHARTNNAEMVKLLLSLKADVNSRPGELVEGGELTPSPLESATGATGLLNCDADVIDALITAGADPSLHGVPVLGWVALRPDCSVDGEPITQFLLRRYESIRILKDSEFANLGSILRVACRAGNVDAAFALLAEDADVGDDDNVELLCGFVSKFARALPALPPVLGRKSLTSGNLVYKWSCQIAKLMRALRAKRQLVHGRTELHFAVETLNIRRIIELFEEDVSLVSLCDDRGQLPVHMVEDAEALEGPELQRVSQVKEFLDAWLTYEQKSLAKKSTTSAKASHDSNENARAVRLREHPSFGMKGGVILLPGQPLVQLSQRDKTESGEELILRPVSYPIYEMRPAKNAIQRGIILSQHVQATIGEFGENTEEEFLAQIRLADHLSWMQKPDPIRAVQHAECVANRCRSAFGPEHRLHSTCNVLVSRALYNSNQNDKAISLLEEVISTLHKTAGITLAQTEAITSLLCFFLRDSRRFEEADEASQKCLGLLKKSGETNGPRMVAAHLLIGECKIERGRHQLQEANCDPSQARATVEDAVTALETAVGLARESFEEGHVHIYTCLYHLATAHALLGQDDRAKQLFQQIVQQQCDQTDPETIRLIDGTQRALRQLGLHEPSLAEEISRQERRLEMMRAYADHHSDNDMRNVMMDLAKLYETDGQVERALHLVQQTLAWRVRSLGTTHADTIETKFAASKLLEKLRKFADAERLQREILDHYDQIARGFEVPAEFHEQRRILSASIANLCFAQMKYRQAEQMNQQALQNVNGPPLYGSAEWVDRSLQLATTSVVHGNGDEGERLSRQVLRQCLERTGSGRDTDVPRAFSNLCNVLQLRQKHEEAVSCALDAVRRDPRSSLARIDLMTARMSCGRSRDAILAGKAAMKLLQTQNDPFTTENGLCFLYFRMLSSNFLDLREYEKAIVAGDEALLRFEELDGPGKSSRLWGKLETLRYLKTALRQTGDKARVIQVSKEISSLETAGLESPLSTIQADQRNHLLQRAYEASQLGLEEGLAQMRREGVRKNAAT